MNQNVTHTLHEVIMKQLHQSEFDVVGIIPIPAHNDKMTRLRSLQEILEDFEEFKGKSSSNDTLDYLLQIRPRRQSVAPHSPYENPASKPVPDNIYLPNGKLNIPYLVRNADLLCETGEYTLAKNIFKTILKSGENTSLAFFRIGICLEAEGKLEEAKSHYDESIAYHPSIEAFQKLSSLFLRQNKDLQAAEILERATHIKELHSSIRFDLFKSIGNCYTRAKKNESAEKYFKKALEIHPTADEIRANLGALYLQANRVSEAKRHFRDAIASNPGNHQALTGLGSCAMAEDDKKAAHDLFAQALEADLNNPTAIFYLVKCAYEIKSYGIAAKFLNEYIQIAPINPNLLYSLAGLQFHLGRVNEAKQTVLRVLGLQAEHVGAKDLLSMIERYTGPSEA